MRSNVEKLNSFAFNKKNKDSKKFDFVSQSLTSIVFLFSGDVTPGNYSEDYLSKLKLSIKYTKSNGEPVTLMSSFPLSFFAGVTAYNYSNPTDVTAVSVELGRIDMRVAGSSRLDVTIDYDGTLTDSDATKVINLNIYSMEIPDQVVGYKVYNTYTQEVVTLPLVNELWMFQVGATSLINSPEVIQLNTRFGSNRSDVKGYVACSSLESFSSSMDSVSIKLLDYILPLDVYLKRENMTPGFQIVSVLKVIDSSSLTSGRELATRSVGVLANIEQQSPALANGYKQAGVMSSSANLANKVMNS